MHLTGYDLPIDELKQFRKLGSATPGHPEVGVTPDIFIEEEGDDFTINTDKDNQLNYAIKLFNS